MASQSKPQDGKTKGGALDIHEDDVTQIATETDLKVGEATAAKPSGPAENTKRNER